MVTSSYSVAFTILSSNWPRNVNRDKLMNVKERNHKWDGSFYLPKLKMMQKK
jgi:hypothetical protein